MVSRPQKGHTYIIAEAGVNHNGNIALAKQLILLAKEAGADAVKFQTFKAEESTGVFADKADYQKNYVGESSQLEMIRSLELPFSSFYELKQFADSHDIEFISTPDGIESLKCLLDLDVVRIKIGSTEVTNLSFLEEVGRTKKPIILSTGMSNLGEVEKAIETLEGAGCNDITIMHCTTAYPTEIDQVNIRAMITMHDAFKLPVGFSDHTISNEAAIAAVTLGATCIEKHITIDKNMEGPDHKASMNRNEFISYVNAIRNTEALLGTGRKVATDDEKRIMKNVRRSVLASRDLPAGTIITKDMLCYKRPGTGIKPEFGDVIVGMRLTKAIEKEQVITWGDFK